MTTKTSTFAWDHSTDAGFRIWGSGVSTLLQSAGLVQTADTGQINWTTVVRAGANADAGYEIYKLNDSLEGTANIRIRINYGTDTSGATVPRINIIAGTGSNGAGTINGQTTGAAVQTTPQTLLQVPGTVYPSYCCVKNGFVGILIAAAGGATGPSSSAGICWGFFAVGRTTDSTGAYTTTGFQLLTAGHGGGSSIAKMKEICVRTIATAASYTQSQNLGVLPWAGTTTVSSGNVQFGLHWLHTPDVSPSINTCCLSINDVPAFSTFQATLFGSTQHNYISLGTQAGYGHGAADALVGVAMMWE